MHATSNPHGGPVAGSAGLGPPPGSLLGRALGPFAPVSDARAVLRTAVAAAVSISVAFFLGDRVVGGAQTAVFSVFGGFAIVLYAHLGGDRRDQVVQLVRLAVLGAASIALGSVLSSPVWLAVAAMLVVGTGILVGRATIDWIGPVDRALLLTFILPLCIRAGAASVPSRLTGWAIAVLVCGPAALLAASPKPEPDPLRSVIPAPVPQARRRSSIRGAVALAAAVGVAGVVPLQHAFWIVLATLSALRPDAVGTVTTALRATVGTAVGFVIGAALVLAVGVRPGGLWLLLPLVILAAGLAPATLSFACGQAAFTVVCVVVFNVLHPSGWIVGVARLEDVVVGGLVAVVVTLALRPEADAGARGPCS